MAASPGVANILRFGVFELDIANSELRRAGVLIKLTPQQYRLLYFLASHPGEILAREQIQREIWGPGTFVDFDRSLNVYVAQLRAALNDDSENARFIETVPRRGYRFVAPVSSDVPRQQAPSRRGWIWVVGIAMIGGVVASYFTARIVGTTNGVRLAVLPFESLDQDARDGPVLDGLTEELISDFGILQPARLGVIGRSSVMRYKGAAPGLDRIGRELRVSYVVEGSLRRNSGKVRLTARLLRVRDQLQVWTETFEQDDSNLFDMQEDAAARITAGVLRCLFPESKVQTRSTQTRNRDAYQAYINGQYLEHKNSLDDLRRSASFFGEAARLDPAFAEAQAALASAYIGLGRAGAGDADVFDRAKAAAEKALRLDNSSATAHNALANALFWHEWNWTEAERHFSRAIAINPSFPLAQHDYAFYLVAMGRTEEGLSALRRAMALDPLSTRVNMDAGWLLLQAHRFDQAIEQAKRALALEPGLEEANACILRAKEYQGRSDADSVKRLRAMLDRPDQIEPFSYATACALTGEKSKALDALERAYAGRSTMMPLLKTEPSFSKLHSEPRFQALAARLHLP